MGANLFHTENREICVVYWNEVCPICTQGRLLVMKILGANKLFLLCEECDSAWASPEEVSLETYFDFGKVTIGYADPTDVIDFGWEKYQLSIIQDG